MPKRSESDWQALLEQHAQSGLSVAAFCREQSLCPTHFGRKRQLYSQRHSSFVTVQPTVQQVSQPESDCIEIRIIEATVPSSELGLFLKHLSG